MRVKLVIAHIILLCFLFCAVLAVVGCGLEQPVLNQATDWGPDWVPEKPDSCLVRGQVYSFPNGTVEFFTPSGGLLPEQSAGIGDDGVFDVEFPGSTAYRNLVVQARPSAGSTRLFGLCTRLPRNRDIYVKGSLYELGGMPWGAATGAMNNIDDRTTAMTLAMLRWAFLHQVTLAAVSLTSTNQALADMKSALDSREGPVFDLFNQVKRLLAASTRSVSLPPVFLFPDEKGVFLNQEFLDACPVDYSGDGMVDETTDLFELALDMAAGELTLSGCVSANSITVVFMVDMREGTRDLNCNVINRFKVATNVEGKTMFITGGMETDDPKAVTPVCAGERTPDCITQAEWAEVNSKLGNWIPNMIPMRDDGQGGDSVAGDGIWTLVLKLPYIPTHGKRKGVRIGYKYTYGFKGQGWRDTEEWSGNHRILELEDLNADGMVVRYDFFGDETSNKNVVNLNKGLCGSTKNPWPDEAKPGCFSDAQENKIDTDGDCIPDTYPKAGSVTPECDEADVPPIRKLEVWEYRGHAGPPMLTQATPASGRNGGGFLVELKGANLHPSSISDIEVNTADSGEISGNKLPGFLVVDPTRILFTAPPFIAGKANVTLLLVNQEDGGASLVLKTPLQYFVEKTVPAGLVFPAKMPDPTTSVPTPKEGKLTVPILARLLLGDEDPAFLPQLVVELGSSPPCCNEGEKCVTELPLCSMLPDPRFETGWEFFPMALDSACMPPAASDLPPCEPGVFQFVGTLSPRFPRARYRYVMRYSFDFGLSWDYGDLAPESGGYGNSDGFKLKDAGEMWVE